jgi:hypothetical protein
MSELFDMANKVSGYILFKGFRKKANKFSNLSESVAYYVKLT